MFENGIFAAIGLGNFLALVGFVVKVWGWTTKVENRIAILEQKVEIYNESLKDLLKQITVYRLYLDKDKK